MQFEPKGIIPAMVTPLTSDGKINVSSLRKLTDYLIEGGVHGVFPVGSQGEFYALTFEEKKKIIEVVVEQTCGRVPVYAGTGAVTTREAVALTQMAEGAGAAAVSVTTPYFIKPTDAELLEYYRPSLSRPASLSFCITTRRETGVNISADFVVRASRVDNIVGVKYSSGDMTIASIKGTLEGRTFLDPGVAGKILDDYQRCPTAPTAPTQFRINNREQELLKLLASGLTNSEIAHQLYLSEGTVRNYTSELFKKLGVSDRTQAVVIALRHGLVNLNDI